MRHLLDRFAASHKYLARIGKTPVYMRPMPLTRRRLWLVKEIRGSGRWMIRHYRTAAHLH